MNNTERAWSLNKKMMLSGLVFFPVFVLLLYVFGENKQVVEVLGLILIVVWIVGVFFTIKYFIYFFKSWFE